MTLIIKSAKTVTDLADSLDAHVPVRVVLNVETESPATVTVHGDSEQIGNPYSDPAVTQTTVDSEVQDLTLDGIVHLLYGPDNAPTKALAEPPPGRHRARTDT